MRRAIVLARRGGLAVRPNPRVGAVLVKKGRVVAEGWHRVFGGPHAEIEAFNRAGEAGRGATLYVTLEPCSSFGKTPPCVDEILRRRVKRVVIGCLDRDSTNRNRSASLLRENGVEVTVGVLEEECRWLNRDFFTWVEEKRPYTLLKLALSLDGKIAAASGRSRWISSETSRRRVHYLRSRADAVVVGLNTVITDNPRLTVRYGYHHPGLWKVVLDGSGRIPLTTRLVSGRDRARTIVATTPAAPPSRMDRLMRKGVDVIRVPARRGRVSLRALFRRLAARGMIRVMIEGGGETAASALEEGLVDEVHFFLAPLILGGRSAPSAVGGEGVKSISRAWRVERLKQQWLGGDLYLSGTVTREGPLSINPEGVTR